MSDVFGAFRPSMRDVFDKNRPSMREFYYICSVKTAFKYYKF